MRYPPECLHRYARLGYLIALFLPTFTRHSTILSFVKKHNEIVPAWEAYLVYTVFTFSAQEVCLYYRRPDKTLDLITQDNSTGRENS